LSRLSAREDSAAVGTPPQASTATSLFETRMLNGPNTVAGFRAQYDVTRDGQRFLLNVPVEDAPSVPTISVVVNWSAALRK
jgi:hypothetical protein